MTSEMSDDKRRARIVAAAVSIAARDGIDALDETAVAEAAELPHDAVAEFFPQRGALLDAIADTIVLHLTESMNAAIARVGTGLDVTGVRALRILLHAGLSAVWPVIESTPHEQILAFELTVNALRRRGDDSPEVDRAAREQYRMLDSEAVRLLEHCAELSATMWLEPAGTIATFALSMLQGMILRWLVDDNDETMITLLDDLVTAVTAKAADLPH